MYQAQILQEGQAPTSIAHVEHITATLGGLGTPEEVDATEGIYLIPISDYHEARLVRDGWFSASINGYTVEIELP